MFLFRKSKEEIVFSYDPDYNYLSFRFVLNRKSIMLMSCQISGNKIHINDIKPCGTQNNTKYFNKGYGSKLINALLNYATKNGVSEIYGELAEVDSNHKDRLHHFYKKFGFNITIFPELKDCYYGSISKIL